MELNREQIIKALECCASDGCETCPNSGMPTLANCVIFTMGNALSLIKELSEEYESMANSVNEASDVIRKLRADKEELIEESKKWEEAYYCMDSACRELSSECDRLTEENAEVKANWQKLKESHESACEKCRAEFKRLTEENESLSQSLANSEAEHERLKLEYAGFEAGAKDVVSFLKADTVQKMHSEIKERCIKGGIYPAFVANTIDQIAKEMLEGT